MSESYSSFQCKLFQLLCAKGVTIVINGYEIDQTSDFRQDPLVLQADCCGDFQWYFMDQDVQVVNGVCSAESFDEDIDGDKTLYRVQITATIQTPVTEEFVLGGD